MADCDSESRIDLPRALRRAARKAAEEPAVGVDLAKFDLQSFLYKSHGARVDEFINTLEERTKMKREQLSYIAGALFGLYLMFGGLANFICSFVGFAYPCYESVKAIRSEQYGTKWLTYWIVFAAFSLVEFFVGPIVHVLPDYLIAKALFLTYLYLPQTNGAEYLYKAYIDPAVTAFDKICAWQKGEQASAAAGTEPSQQAKEANVASSAIDKIIDSQKEDQVSTATGIETSQQANVTSVMTALDKILDSQKGEQVNTATATEPSQ